MLSRLRPLNGVRRIQPYYSHNQQAVARRAADEGEGHMNVTAGLHCVPHCVTPVIPSLAPFVVLGRPLPVVYDLLYVESCYLILSHPKPGMRLIDAHARKGDQHLGVADRVMVLLRWLHP